MNILAYNLTNLLGLVLILTGSIRLYGIDTGLIISGFVLIVLNMITLAIAFKLRNR
jgi:hypothetical protein